ncbi:Guanine nucleotide-binding protein G(t) subunit alpha-1 [Terramyces sp. JEL0728]|nr:Guanine nucleotide-binding protein G(t) subunit alpha-1 [Terramyces sp. JEL0728]
MTASPKLPKHKDVEQYLKVEKKQFLEWQKEPKLLILGSSDCGKSTLIKQLKIMHLNGFTEEEKSSARINILNGLIMSINKSVAHLNRPSDTNHAKLLDFVNGWPTADYIIPVEIADIILDIWKTQEVQDATPTLQIPETTDFFMNDIHRIIQPSFIPTNLDILNLRTITMNISETAFTYKNKKFHFFDVSGLSYHRKFWIAYFDCVHTILFVTSLASYDQVMIEDSNKNRMNDSITLFSDIVNHPLLFKQNLVLFMNKKDIFEKKVKTIPIRKYFPEFDGLFD